MPLFCEVIPASESHSEGFGLLKGLEGVGDSGSGPTLSRSILGESSVDSSVQYVPRLEVARVLVEASCLAGRNTGVCAVLEEKINPDLTGDTDDVLPRVCKSRSQVC